MRLRTALTIGFLLQLGALALGVWLAVEHSYRTPNWVLPTLAPGVALFWGQGIHSSAPLLGLVAALALDTALYTALVYGIARWLNGPLSKAAV